MKTWEYDISFHSMDDLGLTNVDFPEDQVIACDTEGHCFFSDVLRPYMDVFKNVLNDRGVQGWELVQISYHKGSLVCFWKREKL